MSLLPALQQNVHFCTFAAIYIPLSLPRGTFLFSFSFLSSHIYILGNELMIHVHFSTLTPTVT